MSKKLIQAAAGAGGESVYVEDVFSTYLYEGDGNSQTITNGIDLSGEGGMLWWKRRDSNSAHFLTDSERGITKHLQSQATSADYTDTTFYSSFNSDGFTMDTGLRSLQIAGAAIWTFRKQAGFFDVVTYTGTGSNQTISHNLGSVPACIIVKNIDAAYSWRIYHESLGNTKALAFSTAAASTNSDYWNNTSPTSTQFTVGSHGQTNNSGDTYVAYLFAHDDQSFGDNGDESIIKCGSYTGTGASMTQVEVDLGFEPQWLLLKSTVSGNWHLLDNMRPWTVNSSAYAAPLYPNLSDQEYSPGVGGPKITSTGFVTYGGNGWSDNGETIYIAIRRPMKTPEAGTEVFSAYGYQDTGLTSGSGTASNRTIINGGVNGGSGFPVDLFIHQWRDKAGVYAAHVFDRLRGKGKSLLTNSTAAEPAGDGATNSGFDFQEGVDVEYNGFAYYYTSAAGNRNHITYHLKRATGCFDAVGYTGTGSAHTEEHNLGVAPELMIVKARNGARAWRVYSDNVGNTGSLRLNADAAKDTGVTAYWNNTSPTSSVFTVGTDNDTNSASYTYIAYLFATLAGISKVGSYTGTGSNVDVDCGFSAGARFVLIKRTDSSGDWYVYDSERGIVAGNDPYLLLNSTAAEVTSTDYIDPLSSGFTVTSSAPAGLNASGGTYIFLAIS